MTLSHHVYITVHDQDIVLDFESSEKYRQLKDNYFYVFVGLRDCEKIQHLDNVIVARDQNENIEEMKNFVDFTAWYVLARNKFILADYVSLIQYDTVFSDDFYANTGCIIRESHPEIIGYTPMRLWNRNFVRNNMGAKPLRAAVQKVHGYDPIWLIRRAFWLRGDRWWSNNNACMSKSTFLNYVDWFSPLVDVIGNGPEAGHAFERSIKAYALEHGIDPYYIHGKLEHLQLNAHGSQELNRSFGEFRDDLISNSMNPK